MPQQIERGNPITLDLLVTNDARESVDATDVAVSILDPAGATVVDHAAPSAHVATGHYQYVYAVAADAQVGAWAAKWFATVDATTGSDEDGFTVTRAGTSSVPASGSSVCQSWATHEDALGPCAEYGVDPDLLDDAMLVASDVLWNLTGRKWPGVCSDIIRPQAQWRPWDGLPRWWPAITGSTTNLYGWCSCHRGRETGCANVPEVKLPGGPVIADSIVVKIDGLEFFDFRLDDHRYLVRTDGHGWPCCQHLQLEDTEEGTWSVAYDFGRMAPIGGQRAAASLGCELAMLYTPDLTARCRIPKRATNINRQGVSINLLDPTTLFKDGITGIPEVDLWVSSERLGASRRMMTVMIPGRWRSSRRVGR